MAGFWDIEPEKRAAKEDSKYLTEFQTPVPVANYMASLIPPGSRTILEPTKGIGNLVRACGDRYDVTAPDNFFEIIGGGGQI